MSLPPVQPLIPEAVSKPKSAATLGTAQDAERSEESSFEGELKSVQNESAVVQPTESAERQEDAVESGNDVPVDSLAEVFAVIPGAINLEIVNPPSALDESLLLTTHFSVDTLQKATTLNIEKPLSGTPESLIKLQPLMSGLNATGNSFAALAPMPPILLDPESVVDSLVKSNDKPSVVALTEISATQQPAEKIAPTLQRTELTVPTRVGSTDWSEAMAGRITLMVNQKISAARIHVNPPELGPIEVRVNLNNEQASVQFTSSSSQVRDALEQSLPRLRDMLESAGFSLADSDVSDQKGRRDADTDRQERSVQEEEPQLVVRESVGLVDERV